MRGALYFLLLPLFLNAGSHPATGYASWQFVENKGQLRDGEGNAVPDVKFYGHLPGVNVYF